MSDEKHRKYENFIEVAMLNNLNFQAILETKRKVLEEKERQEGERQKKLEEEKKHKLAEAKKYVLPPDSFLCLMHLANVNI